MRIAVEGCAHGELEIIYDTIAKLEEADGKKIDLLICCGDFQSTRNLNDLQCMAVPDKFKSICTFYKYYSGEKVAPILTIFVGGNHEASNYLQELPYGGWVAPNIYYLGYAGVVTIGGLRIAGISGIYKGHDWLQGRYEMPPYTEKSMKSVYHVRNLEVFRLKQLSGKIEIFLSHDWPNGVTDYGDVNALLRRKQHFKQDIDEGRLGSTPSMELLTLHYPDYWFSAHLHCKFAAVIPEEDGNRSTKFLALDKCLPRRRFLQVLDVEHNKDIPLTLSHDAEWLTVLYLTNHLLSVKNGKNYMPGVGGTGRYNFTPTAAEVETTLKKFKDNLAIPENFKKTVDPYKEGDTLHKARQPPMQLNDQTTLFCDTLGIDDPSALLQHINGTFTPKTVNDSLDQTYESFDASSSNLLDDSQSSVTPEKSSPNVLAKLGSMNLPSPKYYTDTSGMSSEPFADSSSSLNNSQSSQPESQNDEKSIGSESEPNPKKFKRRNHSMYSDNLS